MLLVDDKSLFCAFKLKKLAKSGSSPCAFGNLSLYGYNTLYIDNIASGEDNPLI